MKYSKVAANEKTSTDVPQQVYMTHEELHDDELLQYGGLEFPQINYAQYNGRPYRFFYSCGFGHVLADSLLKMDVHTKELKVPSVTAETSLLNPAEVGRVSTCNPDSVLLRCGVTLACTPLSPSLLHRPTLPRKMMEWSCQSSSRPEKQV